MANYKAIAEQVLAGYLMNHKIPLTGQSKILLYMFGLSSVLAISGFIFMLFGAYIFLEQLYSVEVACAVIGLVMFSMTLVLSICGWAVLKYKERQLQKMKSNLMEIAQEFLDMADEYLSQPVNDHPKTYVAMASVAGYVAGKSIK